MDHTNDQDSPLPEAALLHAFDVYADGRGEQRPVAGLSLEPARGAVYRWIHLDLASPATAPWLASRIDDVVAASVTAQDTRPRCVRHDGGVLLNLRGVNLNPDADPEDMVSVRLWITKKVIVSVRIRRLLAVVGLSEMIESGDGPTSIAAFLAHLTAGLTEKIDPVIMGMTDRVDDLETESLEKSSGLRGELARIRRRTIILRRYIAPQREALTALAAVRDGIVDDEAATTMRETVDRVTRMVEELDAVRERCAILNDQLTDQRAEEMNNRLMVLSVAAAIFLPLGFLTGLLGVNIAGLPGVETPWAFTAFCVMLTAIGVGLVVWFRAQDWL